MILQNYALTIEEDVSCVSNAETIEPNKYLFGVF